MGNGQLSGTRHVFTNEYGTLFLGFNMRSFTGGMSQCGIALKVALNDENS
jgi:hypothetical protein